VTGYATDSRRCNRILQVRLQPIQISAMWEVTLRLLALTAGATTRSTSTRTFCLFDGGEFSSKVRTRFPTPTTLFVFCNKTFDRVFSFSGLTLASLEPGRGDLVGERGVLFERSPRTRRVGFGEAIMCAGLGLYFGTTM